MLTKPITINPAIEVQPVKVEKSTVKYSRLTPDITIPQLHWKRDKPDPRDYSYTWGLTLPANSVDLRQYCSPIEDQGNLGSCTGNAVAGAIELLNKRNRKPTDVSRLFIYYYERLLEGTVGYDSGAYIRDGIRATYTYGAPLESLWPYQINRFTLRPSTAANTDGLRRKVTLYQRANDINAVIDSINSGFPVIIGFDVYSSFYDISSNGIMRYPNLSREVLLGGHAVLLVGYNQTSQYFIARNSWGAGWGDRGYFYMPFDVIRNSNMSSDFWVIKAVNNP
jgi:C1A family cysteine protease